MRRRRFIEAAAAAVATPYIVGATDKAGAKPPVVGNGEHTYECHHNWGTLPKHLYWETTHNVCVDAEGLVYVTHQGHGGKPALDVVVVFDRAGKFVRSFGKEMHPGGHGLDVRREGGVEFLYHCDVFHRQVLKTDLKGELVWKKGFPKEANVYQQKQPYSPTNVAFAPDGGFYVADGYGSHYIHQYDKDAKYVRTWGGFGTEPGKMKTPHGIVWDDRPGREPTVTVADRANARLQLFSPTGEFKGFVNDLLFPAHFDIRGEVLMVPDLHARVSLFDKDNKPIVHLGDDPAWIAEVKKLKIRNDPAAWPAGKFIHPHDACFDKDGNIFVVEWVDTGRVTFLKKV